MSSDTPCVESIIYSSCISGRRERWAVAKSLDAPEDSLVSHPVKRLMLCLLQEHGGCLWINR